VHKKEAAVQHGLKSGTYEHRKMVNENGKHKTVAALNLGNAMNHRPCHCNCRQNQKLRKRLRRQLQQMWPPQM